MSLVQQEGARSASLENDVAGLLLLPGERAVFIQTLALRLAPAALHQRALSLTCGNQAGLKPPRAGSQQNQQIPLSWCLWKPDSAQAELQLPWHQERPPAQESWDLASPSPAAEG